MNDLELAQLAERLRRLEESLEPVPRGPLAGGGWREPERHCCFIGEVVMAGMHRSSPAPAEGAAGFVDSGHTWLRCNGQQVSKTGDYAALYAAIGDAFAQQFGMAAPDAGKFRVPNFEYEVAGCSPDGNPYSVFPMGATGNASGESKNGLASWRKIAAHAHKFNVGGGQTSQAAQWDHGHSVYWPGSVEVAAGAGQVVSLPGSGGTSGASYGPHAHDVAEGATSEKDHLPPYLAVGFYILGRRS